MKGATILIAGNDSNIVRALKATFVARGYSALEAKVDDNVLRRVREHELDLFFLCVGTPDFHTLALCREVRRGTRIPIILLTTLNIERDRIMALDAGADDCIVRPIGMEELVARIRAVLRRSGSSRDQPPFESGDLAIDFEGRSVFVRKTKIHVTPKEFALLSLFVANLGKPLTHRRLLQAVWGPDYGEESQCLRVQISQLRKKIEPNPGKPRYIRTEPWLGYRFEPQENIVFSQSDRRNHSVVCQP